MKLRLAVLLSVALGLIAPVANAKSERPNVVFILADDLGYGDIGCYGAPDIKTPNIDRLAKEGVRFTDFYANGCVCTPTRTGLMTGRYQQRIGGLETAIPPGAKNLGLPKQEKTIASMLREKGYSTALCGKWHLGYKPEMMPTSHGFDHFFGLLSGNHDYFTHKENNGEADLYLEDKAVEREGYSTQLITEDAVKFLNNRKGAGEKPFFLYVAYNAPHSPYQGPDDIGSKPQLHTWTKGTRETYVKMVEEMDRGIGQILETLAANGLVDNTLVAFNGDNGGAFLSRNEPLAKKKGTLWEGGIRVPCIARFPGRIPAGTETHQVGITMDWTATIAKLAGVKAPKNRAFEGIDLLPIMSGKAKQVERTLFWRNVNFSFEKMYRAVRDVDWKYIESYNGKERYLYNLANDIGEKTDVLKENPKVADKLKAKLDRWEKDVDPPLYPAEPSVKPQASLTNRPNVLLIMTDDQGYGDFSSHGNPILKTPNFDRLASQSVEFDRFYVSPVCAPTRASLLTGRYWLRSGVWGVTHGKETMRSEETTVAEILRDAGYRTGAFGKWHNGEHFPCTPQAQGFEQFFGFRAGHWNQYFDTTLERNGKPVPTSGFITDVIADEAIKFIQQKANAGVSAGNKPFFCYVPFNAPHAPFQVPDKYFEPFKKAGLDDETAAVYGMCANVDDNLGRLLATLEETKLAENTIVLFLTDNGANTDRFNAGMRGRKGSAHEGGTRVPLLVRWPGKFKPAHVQNIAAHIDVLPTLLDLCGVGVPGNLKLDGRSLRPLLEGRPEGWADRTLFTFQARGEKPEMFPGAARSQNFRLVNEGNGYELYDMVNDPNQKRDIASEKPEIVKQLSAAYENWFRDVTTNVFKRPTIPVGYREQNPAELMAPEAVLNGGVFFKNKQGFAHDWIAGWSTTNATVSWNIDVVQAGKYDVALTYLCPKGTEGSRVRISGGGASIETTVTETAMKQIPLPNRVKTKETYVMMEWSQLKVGSMDLPKGPTTLTVQAVTPPSSEVMQLKAVSLRRRD